MTDTYNDLQQSYGRCLRDKRFIEHFYTVFMASHPDVPALFAGTDMQKQYFALRHGISVAILYASGSPIMQRTVERMADVHGKTGHCPVSPQLYPYWIESLLKVIATSDPDSTPMLLARWREAMGVMTRSFIQRYDA
ncbi:globin [Dyella sp. A6]|uniref:globin n=1 Tax=Dyella aluminiiresistens TaxID=3069105 RepID=UPI002E7A6FA8|nr:globin [Dyella sp. A6]